MRKPITLPLPPEVQRCLAHGLYQDDTCCRADNCGRHLTIRFDATPVRPMYRACDSDLMAAYLPMEGFPEDES